MHIARLIDSDNSRALRKALARIFHRGNAQRARQRDAMGVECFCQVQNGFHGWS